MDKRLPALAMALLCIVLIRVAIAPNYQAAARLRKETADARKSLDSLSKLNAQYASARAGLAAALRREGSTGILSAVQKKAEEMGLSGRLKAVTPVTRDLNESFRLEGYDLRLDGVNLKEAVLFAEAMDREAGFYLDRLILEKSKDGLSLSMRLRIMTIRKL